MDESTDVLDKAQLLTFIRTVDKDTSINEEFLALEPLHGTRGQNIYDTVMKVLNNLVSVTNRSSVVTDGAKAMRGYEKSLV